MSQHNAFPPLKKKIWKAFIYEVIKSFGPNEEETRRTIREPDKKKKGKDEERSVKDLTTIHTHTQILL